MNVGLDLRVPLGKHLAMRNYSRHQMGVRQSSATLSMGREGSPRTTTQNTDAHPRPISMLTASFGTHILRVEFTMHLSS